MQTVIDHIVVTAPDLASGADYVCRTLGVELQQGGAHPRMATHNLLLRLGESTYLEVIAVNPAAAPPSRPRWFELDRLTPQSQPRLATWVARTQDIHATSRYCAALVGELDAMTRDALAWLITVPQDGSLPLGGAAPALIQWQCTPHPASKLKDVGCSLHRLEIYHPEPARVEALLQTIRLAGPVTLHQAAAHTPPRLVARIETPRGLLTL